MIESLILAANVTANSALPSAAATNIFSEGTVNFLLPFSGSAVCGFSLHARAELDRPGQT
jgi:hypothetical protein